MFGRDLEFEAHEHSRRLMAEADRERLVHPGARPQRGAVDMIFSVLVAAFVFVLRGIYFIR